MIDLTKLTDAIGKAAELAHASITALVNDAHAARDFAVNAVARAQKDVDDLVAKLDVAAAPAPVAQATPAAPAEAPVAPEAPAVAPVAPAEKTVDEHNAEIAIRNAQG
jgi:hypothetical protein